MRFSRYNYLSNSNKDIKLIYNTRTSFFSEIDNHTYNEFLRIKALLHFNIEDLNFDSNLTNSLLKFKIIVNNYEDDDFFDLKKYLRYNSAFMRKDIGIVIAPTFACNFKCIYCYEKNLSHDIMADDIQDQLVKFIKQERELTNLSLCWHGGEPLLAFDCIKQILNKIKEDGTISIKNHSMVTNGFLLDDEKCYFLKSFHLNSIQITIDGQRDFHNSSRIHKSGIDTYDVIITNIERVFRIMPECKVIVRVNVHSKNRDNFLPLYSELSEKWGNNNYVINLMYANEIDQACNVACLDNKSKFSFAYHLYKEGKISNLGMMVKPQKGGCVASFINSFIIGPKGELYKCWVDVGKKEKEIGNIWGEMYKNSIAYSYVVGSDMFSDEKCRKCSLSPLCDGGCPARRFLQKHNGLDYNPCPIAENDFNLYLDYLYETSVKANV